MRENVKTAIYVLIGVLLILIVYDMKKEDIEYSGIIYKLNTEATKLGDTKYKNAKGSELYEGGIVKGVESYYKVYELDGSVITSYNKKDGLGVLLKGKKPIIEAPLLSKSNEILSVLQLRGNDIKEVDLSIPSDKLINMLNGTLDTKVESISTATNVVTDLKYLRFLDYGVDIIYIDGVDMDYALPLSSEDKVKDLEIGDTEVCSMEEFMDKLLLLEK